MNNSLTGLNAMTGNMVSNADEFQASNSQAQIATADNAPYPPCLQNRAARLFKKSPWLNDISLPLLLLLAGQIAARPANARQEASLDNIIITAQNQFGTVSQLTIRDEVLYLLEEGCHLVMIRQLGADDISSIRALANLRAEEVGLHLQLTPMPRFPMPIFQNFAWPANRLPPLLPVFARRIAIAVIWPGCWPGGSACCWGLPAAAAVIS
jgi:hypothetical protein